MKRLFIILFAITLSGTLYAGESCKISSPTLVVKVRPLTSEEKKYEGFRNGEKGTCHRGRNIEACVDGTILSQPLTKIVKASAGVMILTQSFPKLIPMAEGAGGSLGASGLAMLSEFLLPIVLTGTVIGGGSYIIADPTVLDPRSHNPVERLFASEILPEVRLVLLASSNDFLRQLANDAFDRAPDSCIPKFLIHLADENAGRPYALNETKLEDVEEQAAKIIAGFGPSTLYDAIHGDSRALDKILNADAPEDVLHVIEEVMATLMIKIPGAKGEGHNARVRSVIIPRIYQELNLKETAERRYGGQRDLIDDTR